MGWLKDLTLALPLGKPSLIIWASSRSCAPRKGGEDARSEIQHPRFPRCRARARLGTAARCHRADGPPHRRRWQRPLPGYGVSSSRDSTIWFTRSERALGTDPPRATMVQLKRRCVRFGSRVTIRLPLVLTPADTPAIVRERRRNSWCRAGRSLRPRLATSASCWLNDLVVRVPATRA